MWLRNGNSAKNELVRSVFVAIQLYRWKYCRLFIGVPGGLENIDLSPGAYIVSGFIPPSNNFLLMFNITISCNVRIEKCKS